MGLDETIAALEAQRAAAAQEVAANLAAIDAASKRFVELAAQERIGYTHTSKDRNDPDPSPFWLIRIQHGSDVRVFGDGSWEYVNKSSLRPDRDAEDVEEAMAEMILAHRTR